MSNVSNSCWIGGPNNTALKKDLLNELLPVALRDANKEKPQTALLDLVCQYDLSNLVNTTTNERSAITFEMKAIHLWLL